MIDNSLLLDFDCRVANCSNNGLCPIAGGSCVCFAPFSGVDCSSMYKFYPGVYNIDLFAVSIVQALKQWFYAYQIVFGCLFPILTIAAIIILIRIPYKTKIHIGIFTMIILTGIGEYYNYFV